MDFQRSSKAKQTNPGAEILGNPTPFLESLRDGLKHWYHFQLPGEAPDHICYRVATKSHYLYLVSMLHEAGELLSEDEISGRLISTFELQEPLFNYNKQPVSVVEIPEPKMGSPYKDGYEHLEFVVEDLHAFVKQNSHVRFELKNINRERNPDVSISIGGKTVKFHTIALKRVIELEKKGLM